MPGLSLPEFADKINAVMPVIIKEFASRQKNELYKGKITLPQFLLLEFFASEARRQHSGKRSYEETGHNSGKQY